MPPTGVLKKFSPLSGKYSGYEAMDYDGPISIAENIYWVGFYDRERNLHCNPYLIIDGDEAVLIDAGSRSDFSMVMTNVLQTGVDLKKITHLVYQHYDPDLCSSIPNFEQFIDKEKALLISHSENNVFIRYYAGTLAPHCIENLGMEITFGNGRRLKFFRTPYAHSAGSFVTFDEKSGTLFSSDLFGAYDKQWELFLELNDECRACGIPDDCPAHKEYCPLKGIYSFHRRIMTSRSALRHAMEIIKGIPVRQIAPQHGGVFRKKDDIDFIIEKLSKLEKVGIDGFI